ncbi:unnamed protein product [Schistosoma margrebowiei]|uniref:Uncharacterized protein n=1 Tax=Schistosoma margrebowiei TaxID=48269 RepID=A0A183M5M0_9TREM|nr:unnamed protein product [Schistosoma margrebowiei]
MFIYSRIQFIFAFFQRIHLILLLSVAAWKWMISGVEILFYVQ